MDYTYSEGVVTTSFDSRIINHHNALLTRNLSYAGDDSSAGDIVRAVNISRGQWRELQKWGIGIEETR